MTAPRRTTDIAKEVDQIPINHYQDTVPLPKVVGDTWIREVVVPYDEGSALEHGAIEEHVHTLSLSSYPTIVAVAPGRLTLSHQSRMRHRSN